MHQHTYLRAYMAGIVVPTIVLLLVATGFTVARYVYNVPIPIERVIVIGLDGLEPSIVGPLLDAGELPNLARLRGRGGYSTVATTSPAQTPVASERP